MKLSGSYFMKLLRAVPYLPITDDGFSQKDILMKLTFVEKMG